MSDCVDGVDAAWESVWRGSAWSSNKRGRGTDKVGSVKGQLAETALADETASGTPFCGVLGRRGTASATRRRKVPHSVRLIRKIHSESVRSNVRACIGF